MIRKDRSIGTQPSETRTMNQEAQNSNQEKVVAGIDVGKAHLDVHIAPTGEARQFPNDAGGRRGVSTG